MENDGNFWSISKKIFYSMGGQASSYDMFVEEDILKGRQIPSIESVIYDGEAHSCAEFVGCLLETIWDNPDIPQSNEDKASSIGYEAGLYNLKPEHFSKYIIRMRERLAFSDGYALALEDKDREDKEIEDEWWYSQFRHQDDDHANDYDWEDGSINVFDPR